MTKKAWNKLKVGSIIVSVRTGVKRKIVDAQNSCITLVMVRGGKVPLWSGTHRENVAGVSKTVYVPCDRNNFKVHRY